MTELLTEQNEDIIEPDAPPVNSQEDFPDFRKGIKLPRSPSQWTTANEFFKLTFSNYLITAHDLNNNITTMTTVVYNYNFGFANKTNSAQYERKYRTFTTKDLKKTLKKLKLENGDVLEIKFVAKKLRILLNKSKGTDETNMYINECGEIDHDNLISKNFLGYVKRFFKKSSSLLPSFNLAQCTSYFTKTCSTNNPNKTFCILSWIPKFKSPQTLFKLDPPNRGDICLRCTKITLAHESFCYFFIFCFFVVRRAKRLKFSIVIHWFLRVKENFWLDVID